MVRRIGKLKRVALIAPILLALSLATHALADAVIVSATASPSETPAHDQAPQANPQIPDRAQASGCLDRLVDDCISRIEATLSGVDPEEVRKSLQSLDTVDVNGKRVASILRFNISGHWPGSNRITGITLTLNSQRQVTVIDVDLADNPQSANTEQEYDNTHLFDAFTLALGSECVGASRLSVYKFFQNVVKPKIRADPHEVHFYETSVTTSNFRHAMNIRFCKRLFSYMSDYGVDTSDINEDNPDGVSSIFSASFSDKPQH